MTRSALTFIVLMLFSCAALGNKLSEIQELQTTLLSIHENKDDPELRKLFLGSAVRHMPVDFDSKTGYQIVGYLKGDIIEITETVVLGCGDATAVPGDYEVHIKTHQTFRGKDFYDFDLVYYIRQVDRDWKIIYAFGM